MAHNRVIFNCDELIAACEAAKAAGRPLSTVFSIDTRARQCQNTKYMGLSAVVPNKRGRLMVRVIDEIHVGQIPPLDENDVARMNADRGSKYGIVKKRDRHPTLNVQLYTERVETDDQGNPIGDLPGDEKKSKYFRVCQYVDEFFSETMAERLANKTIIPREARHREYPPNAIVVPNVSIIPLYQTHVSMDAQKNPGVKLVNPICRTAMKFDPDTNLPKNLDFHDFTKRYRDSTSGKYQYEPLLFNGNPVNATNVHLISPHTVFSGIVNMNAVCASTMGLSIPSRFEVVVVKPPATYGFSIDDVFVDDEDSSDDNGGVETKAPKPTAAAGVGTKASESATSGAEAEDDLAGVLSDLGIDQNSVPARDQRPA